MFLCWNISCCGIGGGGGPSPVQWIHDCSSLTLQSYSFLSDTRWGLFSCFDSALCFISTDFCMNLYVYFVLPLNFLQVWHGLYVVLRSTDPILLYCQIILFHRVYVLFYNAHNEKQCHSSFDIIYIIIYNIYLSVYIYIYIIYICPCIYIYTDRQSEEDACAHIIYKCVYNVRAFRRKSKVSTVTVRGIEPRREIMQLSQHCCMRYCACTVAHTTAPT